MNGVHDMGGMHGFGAIVREENEPLFHAPWEAHIRAIEGLSVNRGLFTIDAFRYGIERMAPAHYLRAPYFERWLTSVAANLIEAGFLTSEELDERTEFFRQHPDGVPPRGNNAGPVAAAPDSSLDASLEEIDLPVSRFAAGDPVVTRNVHPAGHTRLPRYARGKRGVIERLHGAQTFPDTNALGLGENPQPLYAVRFAARELWGDSAEARQTVALDLWESYLDLASR